MDAKDLLKKVRKVEIKTKRLSNNLFGGEYHSAFKGRGMTFSEVRGYEFGDDVRTIDWNVTARYNQPFIKVFEEERELTLMLIIDISGSKYFGTDSQLKKDIVTGQSKSQGSGENTTEQFDPRSTTVVNTPGSLQWNVAQDFSQRIGGRYQLTAAGGPGGLLKDSVFGIAMKTGTDFAVGGVKSSAMYSSGPIDIDTTAEMSITATDTTVTTANFTGEFAATEITTADLTVNAAAVDITGSADVSITGANVRITGALIYLN